MSESEARRWVEATVTDDWPDDEPDTVEVRVPLGVLRGLVNR